ncbi:MAG: phosphate ABC transporter ATP-binding protein PstB [Coriobacteriia bacterium]|nr:phosphate ABC transporter ATP-binding protein PstB [Coriobacteriia bacterium]MCL2537069.1 phosphate ABC transporter ATP-binding protein PstB [Coriobacteriia bacterium]
MVTSPAKTDLPSKKDRAGRFVLEDVSVSYGNEKALEAVSFYIEPHKVTAMIGPSGCGKSTLLRCLNRMNDAIDNVKVGGKIMLNDKDIYQKAVDPVSLRMYVGQVFQRPNPFPLSIYDNVAFGPRTQGIRKKAELDQIVEDSLKKAAIFDEVKKSLKKHAFELSGGQQQRLCIARALATKPGVLLMDEPCSALDPISTGMIEETVQQLKESMTVVMVTHNMQQAARVSDTTVFLLRESMEEPAGLVEVAETSTLFTAPRDKRTENYITGRFG